MNHPFPVLGGQGLFESPYLELLQVARETEGLQRSIGFIGIDLEINVFSHRQPDLPHSFQVFFPASADLELEGLESLTNHAAAFLRHLLRTSQSDHPHDGHALAHFAAKELVDREPRGFAPQVLKRHLHRSLSPGIAPDAPFHPGHEHAHLEGLSALQTRSQYLFYDGLSRGDRFASAREEIRVAVALEALIGDHFDQKTGCLFKEIGRGFERLPIAESKRSATNISNLNGSILRLTSASGFGGPVPPSWSLSLP